MTAFSPRVVLPVALLVALLPGCAHPKKAGQDASATPATTSAPGSAVTSEDIQRNPGQPIEQVLMGRFPGVVVTRTAGGLQVRIRGGSSSLEGSNVPLYVLDGIIIDPGPNGSLTGINPEDIESIEVLKDAVSTSMYGMRGANGVIVIKTKRPPPSRH
ncbi:MAG: hypothetical protein AUG74_10510 [Bacteroidetes bacterium 13_1_20CM_4_60_6]|nr:MAG: hypothetical protein AUG74_10510 [Bacteroidetes bacterium 13_1_20CM_4_60_6]